MNLIGGLLSIKLPIVGGGLFGVSGGTTQAPTSGSSPGGSSPTGSSAGTTSSTTGGTTGPSAATGPTGNGSTDATPQSPPIEPSQGGSSAAPAATEETGPSTSPPTGTSTTPGATTSSQTIFSASAFGSLTAASAPSAQGTNDRAAALRLQASNPGGALAKRASLLDLFTQPKTEDSKAKPTNTAELLSSDQASLEGIRSELKKRGETDATEKKTTKKHDANLLASSQAQAAYLENGPSEKLKNAA